MPPFGALAPFRIRSYRYQWPADMLTSWAFEMETLILGWYVLVETNSVVMLTIFGALLYGGTLIAPIVGVWSDRLGHRNMLTGMRAAYALVAAALMTMAFTGTLRPSVVLVLAALTGLVRPSDMGLRGALIADTMPPASLTAAMGISRTTSDTARIFGALTGAGLFAAIGIGPSYVAITAFYLIGAVLTWNTVAPRSAQAEEAAAEAAETKPSPWRELWEGLVLVWNTPRLLAIVWYAFLFNFAVFPLTNGLMPYAAQRNLPHRPDRARLSDRKHGGRRLRRLHRHDAIGHPHGARPHHDRGRRGLARSGAGVRADADACGRHRHADAVRLRPEPDHGLPYGDPAQRLDARAIAAGSWGCGCWRSTACRSACWRRAC